MIPERTLTGANQRLREFCAFRSLAGTVPRVLASKSADGYVDGTQREIVFIANTDNIDEDEEIVLPSGADPQSYFFRVKSVFVDHWYGFDQHVGIARTWVERPSKSNHKYWEVRVRIFNKGNPLCDDVLTVAREAGIGCSIGFSPINSRAVMPSDPAGYAGARNVVDKWNWVELSVTAFPCNPYAGSVPPDVAARVNTIDALVTKGKLRKEGAEMLGFRTKDARVPGKRIIVLDS